MTVADAIALMALNVGIVAVFLLFFQNSVERVVKTHDGEIKAIWKNRVLLQKTHAALIDCLAEQASISQLYANLLIRAYDQLSPAMLPKINLELAIYNVEFQRSLHELDLFSTDTTRRESAMRKLAEEYGDLGSLELMRQCVVEIFTDEVGPWHHCIRQLESRIAARLRS